MVSNDGHLHPAGGSTLDSAAASRKTGWLGFVGLRAATEVQHLLSSLVKARVALGFRVAWLAPSPSCLAFMV